MNNYRCDDCGEICDIVEESFNYAGTHCTYGKSGTHYTGYYVSKCCGAEITIDSIEDNDEDLC